MLRMSKGSSRAASGISASASSTDAGSEATLVDGLLFASISSGATLTRQTFRMGQAITALLRHVASQEVYYFSISVLLA